MSTPDIVLFVLYGVLAGFGGWVVLELAKQNGRLMLRVEELEQRPLGGTRPAAGTGDNPGLPSGSVLNDFALPLLSGGTMTLLQWRGKKVVLIYVSPQCIHSVKLLPDLAEAWKRRTEDSPMPLLVTTGDVAVNRRLFEEHGIQSPVLLQEDTEVAFLHQARVTPMAYLVDEGGFTIGSAVVGRAAILEVLSTGHAPAKESSEPTSFKVPQTVPGSRIARTGLPAGTTAPEFTLPGVDGSTVSLSDYRGRQVLLVFSDPDCGPCQDLAPSLEQIHRTSRDFAVVMISRGDVEANRAKVKEHGLTFPVILQRKWEISREYGMFSTPIGYLIDESGVLASGVAAGRSSILGLAQMQQRGKVIRTLADI